MTIENTEPDIILKQLYMESQSNFPLKKFAHSLGSLRSNT